jgi:MFS family permease
MGHAAAPRHAAPARPVLAQLAGSRLALATVLCRACLLQSLDSYILSFPHWHDGGSGRGRLLYSACMSAFSVGRLLGLPLFGLLAARLPMRPLLVAAAAADALGNLMYGAAAAVGSPFMILVGRIVSGLAAGSGVLGSVYIGESCSSCLPCSSVAAWSMLFARVAARRGVGVVTDEPSCFSSAMFVNAPGVCVRAALCMGHG